MLIYTIKVPLQNTEEILNRIGINRATNILANRMTQDIMNGKKRPDSNGELLAAFLALVQLWSRALPIKLVISLIVPAMRTNRPNRSAQGFEIFSGSFFDLGNWLIDVTHFV